MVTTGGRWLVAGGALMALLLALMAFAPAATPRDDGRLRVVTTFTVLADMARNVAGDHADIVSITKPGAEIHGYEPTPQDIARAAGADLILWNGLNLERWFAQFLSNLPQTRAAVVSDGLAPALIASGAAKGHPNPHGWMGLEGARVYIANIAAALAAADPAHADAYRANAAAYLARIEAALAPARARIAALPENRRWLTTCEGAFAYLARDLGLRELYLWPINADQTGTPQQVRAVVDGVRAHQIPAVFCESTASQKPARQVARETGAAYGGVLYVDSLTPAGGPAPTYLDLLRVTTDTIARGLGGETS